LNAPEEKQVHYLAEKADGKSVRPNFTGVSEAVRKSMKSNRGKNTELEVRFRKALRANGLVGYRVNVRKLPGTPDVAWVGKKVAVFLHGCFWHGCPNCSEKKNLKPSTRAEYWSAKIAANRERDERNRLLLESNGWTVLVFWEHDFKEDPESLVDKTKAVLS